MSPKIYVVRRGGEWVVLDDLEGLPLLLCRWRTMAVAAARVFAKERGAELVLKEPATSPTGRAREGPDAETASTPEGETRTVEVGDERPRLPGKLRDVA